MHNERLLRFEIPGSDALARIAAAPLPFGLQEQSSDLDLFRVVYFDTSTGDLERKGATVRLCIRPDETQTLQVDVVASQDANAASTVRRHAEAQVPALLPEELFAGQSEPARLLRALVDPVHLRPAFELETVRRLRVATPAGDGAGTVSFAFDTVTVRRHEISGELYELEVTLAAAPDAFEGLVEDIERAYGVRLTLTDTVARARSLLDELSLDRLEQDVRAAREVAVVAYEPGRLALCREQDLLSVPTGQGSGQEACRRVLRRVFGRAHARTRLLGTTAGSDGRPALEVWLVEGVADSGDCVWLPLDSVFEHIGAPQLRTPRTLAALHVVARSELPVGRTGRKRVDSGAPAYPIFERAVSAATVSALLEKPTAEELPPALLLNPELSRLAFDERILLIVDDEATPLLEAIRFLSMFGSRLDDFFMTRIAPFKKEPAAGSTARSIDGLSPGTQLDI